MVMDLSLKINVFSNFFLYQDAEASGGKAYGDYILRMSAKDLQG